jgi:hypothetical protein
MTSDAEKLKRALHILAINRRIIAEESSDVLKEIFERQARRTEDEIRELQLTIKLPGVGIEGFREPPDYFEDKMLNPKKKRKKKKKACKRK